MTLNRYVSLEELYVNNRKLVFAFIADYSKEKNFMEEIALNVWEAVLERPEVFLTMEKEAVKAYLRKMVKTMISDYYREIEREQKTVERLADMMIPLETCDPEKKRTFLENREHYLRESLAMLSEEEKYLLLLRFKMRKTAKEVGDILEISEGNVRIRQMRTIRKMRKNIEMLMEKERSFDE